MSCPNARCISRKELTEIKREAGRNRFPALKAADWDDLFYRGDRRSYKANSIILGEGTCGNAVHFVVEGKVRIGWIENGSFRELTRLGSGGVFGEMSMLEATVASADVVAVGHAVIISVAGAEIQKLMNKNSEFGLRFYRFLAITMSNRLRAANKVVRMLN